MRELLTNKSAAELNTKENKLKATALKSVTNINNLIKDLFHTPPSYKTKIIVSWKPQLEEKVCKYKEIYLLYTYSEIFL